MAVERRGAGAGAGTTPELAVPVGPDGCRDIAPTDLAQFIRLDQCQRYLRLRLHERAAGSRFMRDYDVVPQSLPPLLTRSGQQFEEQVEAAISATYPTYDFGTPEPPGSRPDNNAEVLDMIAGLRPGETLVLFQPRLAAQVGDWHLRGDVDVLRLERHPDGALHVLVADIKSSTAGRLEHRLQVACYVEMLDALLATAGPEPETRQIALGVIYRGSPHGTAGLSPDEAAEVMRQRAAAREWLGLDAALLDVVPDPEHYREAVHDLVTGPESLAQQVAAADFATVPFHLSYKCDGCLYNEFCMKWSAEQDDLSLLPHLTPFDKSALQRAGIRQVRDLIALKAPAEEGSHELVPTPGNEALVRRLAATWPVGPRLDELIHRARRSRSTRHDPIAAPTTLPSKGYGSLPYTDATQNPNLVCVYIDAQHDYLHDRIYLLGARVVAHKDGKPYRRRTIVHLTEGPPDSPQREEELFVRWVRDTLRTLVGLAVPDAEGRREAPIHLIFYNRYEQRLLLDGLARHFQSILGATPLYDFVTQLAAFDSPLVTFLDQEIRELKNYPMVCQSLQSVATFLGFQWDTSEPYRQIFRTRMFDNVGKLDAADGGEPRWYTRRARFSSQIPLEYAYAAWGELPPPPQRGRDEFGPYRGATLNRLRRFQARRLEALEHIAADFPGNQQTTKTTFHLPDLTTFSEKATTLGQAIAEFVTIERHVALGAWKGARLAPPERRVLTGDSLLVRYFAADQPIEVRRAMREGIHRHALRQRYEAEYFEANPDAPFAKLTKEQRQQTDWPPPGLQVRLRLEEAEIDCDLDEALALSTLRPGDSVIIYPRWTVDSRLPKAEQTPFTPTPKQLLYGPRGRLKAITVERDEEGRARRAFAEVELQPAFPYRAPGYAFPARAPDPFPDGEIYTLDPDPNNWYAYYCWTVAEGLANGEPNTLYARLVDLPSAWVTWPEAAAAGQRQFLDGLDALHHAGALHGFEPSKRAYIAEHGADPVLLVQGPPGTGKSYTTAFALFARLQGAMAAGRPLRILVSCKTHAATDVLLQNIAEVQQRLRLLSRRHPELVLGRIDPRLLDVPLIRFAPRGDVPDGVISLQRERRSPRKPWERIAAEEWCIVAATPGGAYHLAKDRWRDALFEHDLFGCLVLDEASQMNLPEAAMAALSLAADGQLIVVGDHRQMPPIVHHQWDTEPRRTFQEFRSYQSLFLALHELNPPMIKFTESFRLHRAMADFLRREIYAHDGIPYFSRREQTLPPVPLGDPFIASVLAPEHPLTVIVHDEATSQVRNAFEQELITPILRTLADPAVYGLHPDHGLGVVVPHRAQRAALQEAVPVLTRIDPVTGAVRYSAIDTVERFQGGERDVIIVSATESDRDYLLTAGEFLLDPRRLTVALSRAKQKIILVASRSVFDLFSADETLFTNALLWKSLLRRTCTVRLWAGERHGQHVEVWGNAPSQDGQPG